MDEKQFEKIEEYLNGNMSSEDKVRFETELASNEELSSILNYTRQLRRKCVAM
jgi:hypothetical protein